MKNKIKLSIVLSLIIGNTLCGNIVTPVMLNIDNIKNKTIQEKETNKLVLPDILNKNLKSEDLKIVNSQFNRTGPTIQLAILLDSSNSMDGLIEQTKSQIWKIINELSLANKNNKEAVIQVSLFEYGKSEISINENYLQMLRPLSSDLDELSEKLFNLKTNGGEEFSGAVILSAVNRLNWSNNKNDLKLILIAGNEPFNQGSVGFDYAIEKAVSNNIIVNTIFCGNYDDGVNLYWKKGADLGNGKYMNIQQNDKIKDYNTKYDNEINMLGNKLNSTYVSYNKESFLKKEMQTTQDNNSRGISKSNLVERNVAKASVQYKTNVWDMLSKFSSSKEDKVEVLEDVKNIKEFENLNEKEVEDKIHIKIKERKEIQNKINILNEYRKKDIAKQKINEKNIQKQDIGTVLINNIKDIAKQNGYVFHKIKEI